MYLYLKDNKLLKRAPIISLSKFSRPCVGRFNKETIEPALWYKVLLLDSMFVDCDSRNVYWILKNDKTTKNLHLKDQEDLVEQDVVNVFTGKDQLSTNTNGNDYDPHTYELFATSSNVIYLLDSGEARASIEILKLLHKYILPQVCFREQHRSAIVDTVEQIETRQVSLIKDIEAKILAKKKQEQSLRRHREALIGDKRFASARSLRKLDRGFLSIFLKDVETDIKEMNELLSETDQHVTTLMKTEDETARGSRELMTSKTDLDEVLEVLVKFMGVREEIRQTVAERRTIETLKGSHPLYLDMHKTLNKISNELAELVDEQVKVISVREAAKLTLEEITTVGFSYGFQKNKETSETDTDIIEPSRKGTWATLEEKVKMCVNDKHGEIGSDYEKFCGNIKAMCELKESNLKLFGHEVTSEANDLNNTLESICKEIVNHITEMCQRLAIELKSNSSDSGLISCLYVCYERCISVELVPLLSGLFESIYRQQCLDLSLWLETHSSELDKESIFEDLMVSSSSSSDDQTKDDLTEANHPLPADTVPCKRVATESNNLPTGLTSQRHNITVNIKHSSIEKPFDSITLAPTITSQLRRPGNDAVAETMVCRPTAARGMRKGTTRHTFVARRTCERISALTDLRRARTQRRKTNENSNGAIAAVSASAIASPQPSSQSENMFYAAFEKFPTFLAEEDTTCSLFGKLDILTNTIQYVVEELARHRSKNTNKPVCSDDLLDALVLLICKLNTDSLLKLYAHLELMNCLFPDFMFTGNSHQFSLVNFTAAYQHLFSSRDKQNGNAESD